MADLHQLPLRLLVLDLVAVPVPQFQPGKELGLLVGPLGVRRIGRTQLLLRSFARVLHGERGGDDQHFLQAASIARGDDHARDARVERQLGEAVADAGQRVAVVERIQFLQQLVAVGDGARRRRLEERKGLDIAEMQRLHAQDDAGQRGTQDFWISEGRARLEPHLVVEADADAGGDAAAAAGALVGGGLRDLLDLQLLDLVAVRVALDAGETGIDDVADARHGQRGLGDVGRQHDAAAGMRLEDA